MTRQQLGALATRLLLYWYHWLNQHSNYLVNLLARVLRADGGPDEGEGEGDGDGAEITSDHFINKYLSKFICQPYCIQKLLPGELDKDDWDVVITHFLGVDHCGHKNGPFHSEMSRKLNEMNNAIERVIEQMDDDTTLHVIGDHGMTVTGDHGGDSEVELNALLFSYSKKQRFFVDPEFSSKMMKQVQLVQEQLMQQHVTEKKETPLTWFREFCELFVDYFAYNNYPPTRIHLTIYNELLNYQFIEVAASSSLKSNSHIRNLNVAMNSLNPNTNMSISMPSTSSMLHAASMPSTSSSSAIAISLNRATASGGIIDFKQHHHQQQPVSLPTNASNHHFHPMYSMTTDSSSTVKQFHQSSLGQKFPIDLMYLNEASGTFYVVTFDNNSPTHATNKGHVEFSEAEVITEEVTNVKMVMFTEA